jgi:hypothetical protein
VGALLVTLMILTAVVIRPVAVRLWRAGLISDRALFVASVARFPTLVLAVGFILRVPMPLLIVLTVVSLIPALLLSRVVHDATSSRSPDGPDE